MLRFPKFITLLIALLGTLSSVGVACAEDLIAARPIRKGAIIQASDIITPKTDAALRRAARVIGLEATRNLYPGKPFFENDLSSPTLVKRNAIITMRFINGPMAIETEGRALESGAKGDRVRVINLNSKRTVTATVIGINQVSTR